MQDDPDHKDDTVRVVYLFYCTSEVSWEDTKKETFFTECPDLIILAGPDAMVSYLSPTLAPALGLFHNEPVAIWFSPPPSSYVSKASWTLINILDDIYNGTNWEGRRVTGVEIKIIQEFT